MTWALSYLSSTDIDSLYNSPLHFLFLWKWSIFIVLSVNIFMSRVTIAQFPDQCMLNLGWWTFWMWKLLRLKWMVTWPGDTGRHLILTVAVGILFSLAFWTFDPFSHPCSLSREVIGFLLVSDLIHIKLAIIGTNNWQSLYGKYCNKLWMVLGVYFLLEKVGLQWIIFSSSHCPIRLICLMPSEMVTPSAHLLALKQTSCTYIICKVHHLIINDWQIY